MVITFSTCSILVTLSKPKIPKKTTRKHKTLSMNQMQLDLSHKSTHAPHFNAQEEIISFNYFLVPELPK
jgi:hypothetical protein